MKQVFMSVFAICALTGCALIQPTASGPDAGAVNSSGQLRPLERPSALNTDVAAVPTAARTVEEFDTTTSEQRNEAVAAAAGAEISLGQSVASLGSPSEPGFWLKTPLVSAVSKGRVVYPGTGKSVAVDLIPISGPKTAGSRMSLSAMRLIGAPLTGLPDVQVFVSR